MSITLWHCIDTRSFRPLWALEEIGIDYQLEVLPFPPRARHKPFFDINPLGTVPFLRDGETAMTESSAICQYLADRYAPE
ncbi:MAG: glutathione S-transferase, partial [Rhodobacteraceae bacterium]|nr:glutathione S-transferase [Paracoccaceae bacterium]